MRDRQTHRPESDLIKILLVHFEVLNLKKKRGAYMVILVLLKCSTSRHTAYTNQISSHSIRVWPKNMTFHVSIVSVRISNFKWQRAGWNGNDMIMTLNVCWIP